MFETDFDFEKLSYNEKLSFCKEGLRRATNRASVILAFTVVSIACWIGLYHRLFSEKNVQETLTNSPNSIFLAYIPSIVYGGIVLFSIIVIILSLASILAIIAWWYVGNQIVKKGEVSGN